MHPYSSDESKMPVYSAITIVAVLVAWALTAVTSGLSWPEWLVSPPSLAGVWAGLYKLFDIKLWNQPWARGIGLSRSPDLSGKYDCTLTSVFPDSDGQPTERQIDIEIGQTWTHLSVEMRVKTGSSTSRSISAQGAVGTEGSTPRLSYMYRNRVNPGIADDDMSDHEGAAELRLYDGESLEGTYYNSRLRSGTIRGRRVSAG